MERQTLHRGRLVDHIQLVVKDVAASRAFYGALMAVLEIPPGGSAQGHFGYDELFVSSPDGPEALGKLTGRHPAPHRQSGQKQQDDRRQVSALPLPRKAQPPRACCQSEHETH